MKPVNNVFVIALMVFVFSLTRLLPHPVNFTPILALGLFSGYALGEFKKSWWPVVAAMVFTDLFLGFHSTSLVVYLAVGLMPLLSSFLKGSKWFAVKSIAVSFLASSLFFLVTNFGVWALTSLYSKSFQGLIDCYVAGLLFYNNTLTSTTLYFFSFVAVYKLLQIQIIKLPIKS